MYVVQTYTICDGWTNTWTMSKLVNKKFKTVPEVFNTFEEAAYALDDYLLDLEERQMDYNRAEYRIHFEESF